jgi:RNA polymerase sigma-70 factor (ECF subfamily)
MAWDEIAGVLSGQGKAVRPEALRKRYERLKDRLAEMARRRGLV